MDTRSVQVRHPQPGDLIGTELTIAGVGHGFEGTVVWRLTQGQQALGEGAIQSRGGMVGLAGFAFSVDISPDGAGPATLEVFGDNPSDEGPKPGFDLNTIPVIVIPGMDGFSFYTVTSGDTLSKIVRDHYAPTTVEAIVQANPDSISDPDVIHAGQVLRIPHLG